MIRFVVATSVLLFWLQDFRVIFAEAAEHTLG